MFFFILPIIILGDKMFYKHVILKVNNEDVLYLYLTNYQEFSNEFTIPQKKDDLYSRIKDYIESKRIHFKGKKIMFVVNGLIIGSLMLATNSLNNIHNTDIPFQYLTINKNYIIEQNDNIKTNNNTTLINSNKNSSTTETHSKKESQPKASRTVLIKNKQGKLESIVFDHYLTTIIAMKIPPTYNTEAIKAIAVLLRTDAFKEIYENKYLSNDNNLYQNINILKDNWQDKFDNYYNKLYQIVLATNNQYLSHHNYFLNSTPTRIANNYTIGISNYGANLMAKSGYSYIDILQHYYPNSNISTL